MINEWVTIIMIVTIISIAYAIYLNEHSTNVRYDIDRHSNWKGIRLSIEINMPCN